MANPTSRERWRRLTNSEIRCWMACPRRHQYAYVERLRPIDEAVPLRLGRWVHLGLELLYRGSSVEEATSTIASRTAEAADLSPDRAIEVSSVGDLAAQMVQYYADSGPLARDLQQWQIVAVEQPFEFQLAPGYPASFAGVVDLVVRVGGGLWVVEHKTTRIRMPDFFRRLRQDRQVTGYVLGVSSLHEEPVKGVVYNVLSTSVPRAPTVLKSGRLSSDKRQVTTPDLVLAKIRELGQDPEEYRELLDHLVENRRIFHGREELARSREELVQWREETVALESAIRSPRMNWRNDCACFSMGECPYTSICPPGMDSPEKRASLFRVASTPHEELEKEVDFVSDTESD